MHNIANHTEKVEQVEKSSLSDGPKTSVVLAGEEASSGCHVESSFHEIQNRALLESNRKRVVPECRSQPERCQSRPGKGERR